MKSILFVLLILLSFAFQVNGQETESTTTSTETTETQELATTEAPSADADAEFRAGMKLYRRGRYSQAVEAFERAVQQNSSHAAAYYFMGYAHYVMKHHQEALDSFAKAFKADPTFDPRSYMR